jgi:hypothetical protein
MADARKEGVTSEAEGAGSSAACRFLDDVRCCLLGPVSAMTFKKFFYSVKPAAAFRAFLCVVIGRACQRPSWTSAYRGFSTAPPNLVCAPISGIPRRGETRPTWSRLGRGGPGRVPSGRETSWYPSPVGRSPIRRRSESSLLQRAPWFPPKERLRKPACKRTRSGRHLQCSYIASFLRLNEHHLGGRNPV